MPPRARRTKPWAGIATENAGVELTQGARRPGSGSTAQSKAPAQDALRPGLDSATGKAGWGVAEGRSSPRASFRSTRTLGAEMRGKWESRTQFGQRLRVGPLTQEGNCVATVSVRSVARSTTGACGERGGAVLAFSSYAAVVMRRPDPMAVPTALSRDAKQSGRSAR